MSACTSANNERQRSLGAPLLDVAQFATSRNGDFDTNDKAWEVTCKLQVKFAIVLAELAKPKLKRRSGCPVSLALEILGDRWSLLIIRDLMVRGYTSFKQFQHSGEGIATNILATRLRDLEAAGIISVEREQYDGRRNNYRLTEKGIDLAPALLELLVWGARHEKSGASCALIQNMEQNRAQIIAETRRRWKDRDSTPLIPRFDEQTARDLGRAKRR